MTNLVMNNICLHPDTTWLNKQLDMGSPPPSIVIHPKLFSQLIPISRFLSAGASLPSSVSMLGQRRRRWPSIDTELVKITASPDGTQKTSALSHPERSLYSGVKHPRATCIFLLGCLLFSPWVPLSSHHLHHPAPGVLMIFTQESVKWLSVVGGGPHSCGIFLGLWKVLLIQTSHVFHNHTHHTMYLFILDIGLVKILNT